MTAGGEQNGITLVKNPRLNIDLCVVVKINPQLTLLNNQYFFGVVNFAGYSVVYVGLYDLALGMSHGSDLLREVIRSEELHTR